MNLQYTRNEIENVIGWCVCVPVWALVILNGVVS